MQFRTELFAHFVYCLDLSYEELLATEKTFQDAVAEILNNAGAHYVNFNAFGDTLRIQCVLEAFDEQLFHSLCDAIAPLIDGKLEGRLLFVDKELDNLAIYNVVDKQWQESVLQIPVAGPIGAKLRKAALKK